MKVWRKRNEYPYFHSSKKGRKNIILAITDNKILLYELNNWANKSHDFLAFMKKLDNIIKDENLQDYLIVMDNFSIHLTTELKNFYKEKKMKILTIVPYSSMFNGIEFFFNYIKQKIYKKVFNSFSKMIPFIEKIINDEFIDEILAKIYIKTLNIYKEYIFNNKSINLNSI